MSPHHHCKRVEPKISKGQLANADDPMTLINVTFLITIPLPHPVFKNILTFCFSRLKFSFSPYLQVWTSIALVVNRGFLVCLTCPVLFFFDDHHCGQASLGRDVQQWAEQFSPTMDNSRGRTHLGSVSGPHSQQWVNVFLSPEVWGLDSRGWHALWKQSEIFKPKSIALDFTECAHKRKTPRNAFL